MPLQEQPGHYVKQVTLPDGKTIDVVYFDQWRSASGPQWGSPALHICPRCGSKLVYPLEWEEVDPELWAVEVRCPGCEWTETGVFDQDTVESFDIELDRGVDQLINDLRRLERANMEEAIDHFSYALAHDHIVPEDF